MNKIINHSLPNKINTQIVNAALKSLLQTIDSHVYVKNLEGIYLFCNETQAKSLNLTVNELIGKSDYEVSDFDTASKFRINDQQVINSKQITVIEEQAYFNKKLSTLSSTKVPIFNEQGNIIGILGISTDITHIKEATLAQEEINRLKHERDINLIRSEANKNKIMQDFGITAAKIAHDISSPLMVANSSIYNIENNKEHLETQISLLKQSMQDIKNISNKILTTYREITNSNNTIKTQKVDDGNCNRYVLLYSLLENQIGFKKIEWQHHPCNLELNIDSKAKNIFAYIPPTEFNRSLSNLLNNAYDSLGAQNRNITVNLNVSSDTSKFILTINDSGCGIPEDKIAKVLAGESTKHIGSGIGLSGAKTYFESISAKLELKSILNSGTEITIELPIPKDPTWFTRNINYTSNTIIAVLDDSSTIIMLWQKILSNSNIKSNYFMDAEDFMNWYDEQNNKNNIILFADYDFGNDNLTGLDILNKLQDIESYLVTNHAEEAWIQEIVNNNNNLKLLPKKMIESLKFIST